ncbi:histidine phosphatase family protein [Limoniibacter endophyticus]|uniref:Phosphoglycerate mutase n=1 Tax=Limoniibacter endophyticus TaxID=1565040 RepID=A0A8J3GG91_9HYPH|nr:histidine phosphatase family protein [Limoniibacter endophyticus]GHC71440.1 phosphoglycerate mutase [Limoniibacter endophyticus]
MTRPLIYFVRHGETSWNVERRLQGQTDRPLNKNGIAQATRNGQKLKALIDDISIFDFVASPLIRTSDTMRLLRKAMGLEPDDFRTDRRIIEISFGEWEGSTLPELETHSPGVSKKRDADKWNFVPPGAAAESYEILRRRVLPFVEELVRPTVVVTHGGVIRTIFRQFGGYSEEEASRMHVTQDHVLRFADGELIWL